MSDQATTMTTRERAQSSQEVMERYPILVSHLICESLGYFTPKAAANAIVTHIRGQDFYCEWYADMANRGKNIQDVARDTLMRAFQSRRFHKGYMAEYRRQDSWWKPSGRERQTSNSCPGSFTKENTGHPQAPTDLHPHLHHPQPTRTRSTDK